VAKDIAELLSWLPSIALFGGLEEPSLRRVIAMLNEQHFEPGQEVCKQGEAGRAMFLIQSGEVVVCRDSDRGRRIKVVRMGRGEFFGEMTLIDPQKRSATVVVQQPTVVLSLSSRDLYRLFQDDVGGYVMILQNLCRELSRRLRATNRRLQSLAESAEDGDRTLIHEMVSPTKPL
jgi:CRP/FNR family cyclic AMP-dependent transcriptional regulator